MNIYSFQHWTSLGDGRRVRHPWPFPPLPFLPTCTEPSETLRFVSANAEAYGISFSFSRFSILKEIAILLDTMEVGRGFVAWSTKQPFIHLDQADAMSNALSRWPPLRIVHRLQNRRISIERLVKTIWNNGDCPKSHLDDRLWRAEIMVRFSLKVRSPTDLSITSCLFRTAKLWDHSTDYCTRPLCVVIHNPGTFPELYPFCGRTSLFETIETTTFPQAIWPGNRVQFVVQVANFERC